MSRLHAFGSPISACRLTRRRFWLPAAAIAAAAIAAAAIAAAALIRVCWFRDGSMVVRRCF
jgi:hypothetical protein